MNTQQKIQRELKLKRLWQDCDVPRLEICEKLGISWPEAKRLASSLSLGSRLSAGAERDIDKDPSPLAIQDATRDLRQKILNDLREGIERKRTPARPGEKLRGQGRYGLRTNTKG
jgi:hypothetical protein